MTDLNKMGLFGEDENSTNGHYLIEETCPVSAKYESGVVCTYVYSKTKLFCPKCGERSVWKEVNTDGDYYVGCTHVCTSCNINFHLPQLQPADYMEQQVINQIKAHVRETQIISIGDYIKGYENYGDNIRTVCGWVESISSNENRTAYSIQADDEHNGARGTVIDDSLGPTTKLDPNEANFTPDWMGK